MFPFIVCTFLAEGAAWVRPPEPRHTDFCRWRPPLLILCAQLRKVSDSSRPVPTVFIIFIMGGGKGAVFCSFCLQGRWHPLSFSLLTVSSSFFGLLVKSAILFTTFYQTIIFSPPPSISLSPSQSISPHPNPPSICLSLSLSLSLSLLPLHHHPTAQLTSVRNITKVSFVFFFCSQTPYFWTSTRWPASELDYGNAKKKKKKKNWRGKRAAQQGEEKDMHFQHK